jgi:hypothetical protein
LQVSVYKIAAVLDTGAPVSAISVRIEDDLRARGLLQASGRTLRHRLAGLSIDGYPIPDLQVAVLRRLDRLQVDALLGLDFFALFDEVRFRTRTLRLALLSES